MKKGKKEPWRVIVGCISIAYIVFLWVKNDIWAIYSTMPENQAVPLIATTLVVSLLKVIAIAGGVMLIKWAVSKIKRE